MNYTNPFDAIEKPQFEEIEGVFHCEERGCYQTAYVAKYHSASKLLTWLCPAGHVNSMEDIEFDE